MAVGPDLRVEGHADVWALGDVAAAPEHRGDGVLPQLAPVAMQSGAHVARQIGRVLEGKPTEPFRFRDKGTMATIGRRSAVAELPGRIRLRGTLAWFAWLGLHLLYLAGLRNRLSVLLNWAWGYFTWDRGPRIIFGDRPPAPGCPARRLHGRGPPEPRGAPAGGLTCRPMADDSITAAIDATIDGYLAAFPANDRAAYVGAFAADGWLEDPVGSPRRVGPDGIGGFWDDTRAMADSLDLVPMGFRVVIGNEAVLTLQARPVIGGQTFALDIVDHMTFDDDGEDRRPSGPSSTRRRWRRSRADRGTGRPPVRQTRPVMRSTATSMATRSTRSPGWR